MKNEPAFPYDEVKLSTNNNPYEVWHPGLSKREYFACHLLAGLITDAEVSQKCGVKLAVEWADALLAALGESQ